MKAQDIKRLSRLAVTASFVTQSLACAPVSAQQPACVSPQASQWKVLQSQGDTALGANNYGVAEKALKQALKEAETIGPNDIRVADSLHSLMTLYSVRGQFEKAEPLFERELRVREKALGPEHPQVVALVGKLAQFYMNHGSPQKADKLANLLITFADRKVKAQQQVQEEFKQLDRYYDRSKAYAGAQNLLGKLEEETRRTTADENLELATTLDTLGGIYKSAKKYEMSERMYKNALSFREHALSSNHLALAYSYENLAQLYQAQGKNDLAEPLFKQSLEITEKTLQPGRPEFFKRLDELAQSYVAQGHVGQAEALYKRALTMMEKGQSTGSVGSASLSLANLYVKQGKYAAAAPLLKRALASAEAANGPQHAAVGTILDSYADVLDKIGRSGEAAKMRARARSIHGAVVEKVDANSSF